MKIMPHFAKKIPQPVFWFNCLFFSIIYLISQVLWPEMPLFLWQILFLVLPFSALLFLYDIQNAFEWQGYFLKLCVVVVVALVASLLNNWLAFEWEKIFPLPELFKEAFANLFHPHWSLGWLYDIFQIAFLAAVGEEIFFRGIIFTTMLQKMKPFWAMTLSSLIFAIYHFNPWHFIFLFLLGFFFAYIYYKTKNLTLAMLAHFINNAFGVALYYLTEL